MSINEGRTLSQRKVAPATIAAFALLRIQVSFFGFDAVTRGLTRLRTPEAARPLQLKAHAIGCWYGAAYLQRVMRCPQLLSVWPPAGLPGAPLLENAS